MRGIMRQLATAALLGALTLIPSTAQAMEDNLIDSMLCLARDQILIDLDDSGGLNPDQVGNRVYDELNRQLTNAGIRFEEELASNDVLCASSTHAVYIYVGVTGGSTRAWAIKIDVTDFVALDYYSWVEVWNSLRFGTSTGSGAALGDDLLNRVRSQIRELVDAWQDVN
jgi:hypothetical protein